MKVGCIRYMFGGRQLLAMFGAVYILAVLILQQMTATFDENIIGKKKEGKTYKMKTLKISRPRSTSTKAPTTTELYQSILDSSYNSSICTNMPSPGYLPHSTLPLTALHSFPGSGNTWTRLLLSSLTGYKTGDVYTDGAFLRLPVFSYRKDETVIAVKTHHPFWDDDNGVDPRAPEGRYWERVIILVRHPLDATIAVFNFGQTKSHTKKARLYKFIEPGTRGNLTAKWKKFVHDQIRNWLRCLRYWISDFKGPKHIVFYENLRDNMEKQLVELNEFLGLKLNKKRLYCTVTFERLQQFHRKTHHDKRKLFDVSMLSEAEAVLEDVQRLLTANYTHIRPGFRLPPGYATSLIQKEFSNNN